MIKTETMSALQMKETLFSPLKKKVIITLLWKLTSTEKYEKHSTYAEKLTNIFPFKKELRLHYI